LTNNLRGQLQYPDLETTKSKADAGGYLLKLNCVRTM
jgi:hypothetical protein